MRKLKKETEKSNREYKASAFTTYFGISENAAELYRALSHSENVGPEDIRFTTLSGVLYMARKNDMAFTAKSRVLVVGEHQATLNMNMPLRSAIYYGRTMEKLIDPRNIYKLHAIPIPTPEFYVFYNGTKEQPQERILKLSDAYLEKTEDPMLELKVKMININPAAGHPILEECRPLYEYSVFIQKIRDYMESGNTRDEAIKRGMEDCVREGIMVDFIAEYGTEVRNMLFTEFNMEDALEVRGEEKFAEGKAEGKAGEIHIIRQKLRKNMSGKEIAGLLELDENYIAKIEQLHREYPKESDVDLAARYLKLESESPAR